MKSPQFGTLTYLEITKTIVGSSCGDSTSSIQRWLFATNWKVRGVG